MTAATGSTALPKGPPEPPRIADLFVFPARMQRATLDGFARCWAAGLDPVPFETQRSDARQRWLYGVGRLWTPPGYDAGVTVTNAPSGLTGWHFYRLAFDIVSRASGWDDADFFARCAVHFKAAGLDHGGDWPHPDRPHFQWGSLRASPSDRARVLYAAGGVHAVWDAVGAA